MALDPSASDAAAQLRLGRLGNDAATCEVLLLNLLTIRLSLMAITSKDYALLFLGFLEPS
jgi:hypothetical protein